MYDKGNSSPLIKRITTEVENYLSNTIELSPGVSFSQYRLINRIFKFRNRDLAGTKINSDLSYNYYFDIISPRTDSEVKNLRFDSKDILFFSTNPLKDFAAVFLSNASVKSWMAENGEDEKLKAAVEEFSAMGNIGFKKTADGYEMIDWQNTYITNQKAKTIDDSDLIERYEMTASQLKRMTEWDQDVVDVVIDHCGNKSFSATIETTPTTSTQKHYEIFEFTGEISEEEYNHIKGLDKGDPNNIFLAKVIVGGLQKNGQSQSYTLFCEKISGKLSDNYIFAQRGKYEGRFFRVGMYELLFDHQIRANEIGNQLARGLEWASKVIFKSKDSKVLQNIRADMDNGDVVITEDLTQVDVRMQAVDQLIADWNRLMQDADRLSNSLEVVRGENSPSGTPFRQTLLLDQNAGKLFEYLRQKLTLPYQRVFREWILPELVKDLKGQEIFRLVGDDSILDKLREILVENWYAQNLVRIGPHTKDVADALKAAKLEELERTDPVITNSPEIWKGLKERLFVTITGENSTVQDQIQDLMTFSKLEQDPDRLAYMLDTMYALRGIPIPPRQKPQPTLQDQLLGAGQQQPQPQPQQATRQMRSRFPATQNSQKTQPPVGY